MKASASSQTFELNVNEGLLLDSERKGIQEKPFRRQVPKLPSDGFVQANQ
jgi:hypothetical protein